MQTINASNEEKVESLPLHHEASKSSKFKTAIKIASLVLMFFPLLFIIIYAVGFFMLMPGDGLKPDLLYTRTTGQVVNGVIVPKDTGVYLQTTDPKVYELFPYTMNLPSMPPNPATFSGSQLHYVVLLQNALDSFDKYQLFRMDGGQRLVTDVAKQHVPAPGLAMMTIGMPNDQVWPKGQYMLAIPGDGMDDETYYFFFAIN